MSGRRLWRNASDLHTNNGVMRCIACQSESPNGARYCMHCAAPLPAACGQCGAGLPTDARFCPQCAQPVSAQGARARETVKFTETRLSDFRENWARNSYPPAR
jgi:predicted amidophosphoribosyltransferase